MTDNILIPNHQKKWLILKPIGPVLVNTHTDTYKPGYQAQNGTIYVFTQEELEQLQLGVMFAIVTNKLQSVKLKK